MDESKRKMIENLFSSISFSLTENGKITPLYIMLLPDGTQMPIISQAKGIEITLDMYTSAAHSAAKEMNAEGMIFISEQYMIEKHKDDPDIEKILSGEIKPSVDSNSKEYLVLMYMSAFGECESLISEIHKDPIGTKYTTDEREWIIQEISSSILMPWKDAN